MKTFSIKANCSYYTLYIGKCLVSFLDIVIHFPKQFSQHYNTTLATHEKRNDVLPQVHDTGLLNYTEKIHIQRAQKVHLRNVTERTNVRVSLVTENAFIVKQFCFKAKSDVILHGCEVQFYIQARFSAGVLKTMDVQLLFFGQANRHKEVTDICTLVSLQLNYLSILWIVNHCAITSKFLQKKRKKNKIMMSI